MSECAAIVTRREDREMGKQETARLESSVLRNGSSTVVRRAPTANRDAAGGGIKMPPPAAPDALYNGPTTPKPTGTRYGPLIHVTLNG